MTERKNSLDVLRIVATILIVFHHYQQITGAYFEGHINFFNGKLYFGYLVEFFFLLSGYFMYRYIQRINDGMGFKSFFLPRAARLLPLVLLSGLAEELFVLIYQRACGGDWFGVSVSVWGVIINALGIQDGWVFPNPMVNNPTWYISVLLLCYVVFYLLTYLSKRWKVPHTYLFLFMILLGCGAQTYGLNLPFLNGSSSRGYYAFFFGVLLAQGMESLEKRAHTRALVAASAATVLLLIYLIVCHWGCVANGINYLLTFCLYPALIILFSTKSVVKLLDHKFIGMLGKITYDVYIWHAPCFLLLYIIPALTGLDMNILSMKAMLLYTAVMFVIGTASYYLLEQPINRWATRKLNSLGT